MNLRGVGRLFGWVMGRDKGINSAILLMVVFWLVFVSSSSASILLQLCHNKMYCAVAYFWSVTYNSIHDFISFQRT